jgi:hypothetical protein
MGLDWQHDPALTARSPLVDYERHRMHRRRHSTEIAPVAEEERRQCLARHGHTEVPRELDEEMAMIRESRQVNGCSCLPGQCGTSACICFANEISCTQDACACVACEECQNPQRDTFDPDKVAEFRRAKLKEARAEQRYLQLLERNNAPPPLPPLPHEATQPALPSPSTTLLGGLFQYLNRSTSPTAPRPVEQAAAH